jgi:hypothetical protein
MHQREYRLINILGLSSARSERFDLADVDGEIVAGSQTNKKNKNTVSEMRVP